MDFIRELHISYRGYVNAFRLIDKHKRWNIFIVPAICSVVIAAFVGWFAWKTSDNLTQFAIFKFKPGGDYAYFNSVLQFLIIIFIRGVVLFIYIKIYRYLVLIILAPEFSYITDAAMSLSTEKRRKFRIKSYFSDIYRGIKVASRNFVLEIVVTFFIILFAAIVSWLLPLVPFAIFVVESYFFGYAMADYRNEFFNIPIRESRKIIRKHSGVIIGNGVFFNILLLIPLVGILFGPALAVIASGLAMNKAEKPKEFYVSSVHQSI